MDGTAFALKVKISFCCKVCDFYVEEFHLFEDDILLTRDDLMLLHLLLPPGEAFDEANSLDSEITEDGFMPFQEKTPIQQRRKKRAATAITSKLWLNATIPYVIGKTVTETVKENILQAMNHWESNTCIRFTERESEENFLLFERGPCGCCSYVGRKGAGVQEVTLSPQCASYGVIIHELGHVIGFWHEHSRPDRDQFVKILRENVIPEKLENFDIKTAIEIDSLGEQYDYESVMHYRKKTFSRNGLDTMNTTVLGAKIGQRRGLSPGDVAQTRLLYNCPKPRCHEEFDSIENSFTSPNYPQKYFRDYECSWVIHVSPGEIVTLEFIDFALERSADCSYDYLEIREGDDGFGNVIGRLCGEGVPGTFQVSDSVWINFVTDSEYNFRGFWAHYFKTVIYPENGSGEADESGDLPIGVNSRMGGQAASIYLANCVQLLNEVTGSVSSPLMPIMYAGKPIECSWTIDGGVNASRIQLTIMNKTPEGKGRPERCLGDVYKMSSGRKTNKRMDKKADKAIRKKSESHPNNISGSRFKQTLVTYDCHQQSTLLLASHSVSIQWSSHVNQPIAFSYIIGRLR